MTTQEQLQAAVKRAADKCVVTVGFNTSVYKEHIANKCQHLILTELQPIFDALVKEKSEVEHRLASVRKDVHSLEDQLHQSNERVKELEVRLTKEHLPEEYESWEKVFNSIVECQKERDSLKQQLEEANKAIDTAQFALSGEAPPEFNSATSILYNYSMKSFKGGDVK